MSTHSCANFSTLQSIETKCGNSLCGRHAAEAARYVKALEETRAVAAERDAERRRRTRAETELARARPDGAAADTRAAEAAAGAMHATRTARAEGGPVGASDGGGGGDIGQAYRDVKRELDQMRETLRLAEDRARVAEAAAMSAAATSARSQAAAAAAASSGAGGSQSGGGGGGGGGPYIDPKHHQLLIGQSHRFRAEVDRLKRLDEERAGSLREAQEAAAAGNSLSLSLFFCPSFF